MEHMEFKPWITDEKSSLIGELNLDNIEAGVKQKIQAWSRKLLGNIWCMPSVTGKHIPPRNIIPMGIDSLRNRSEFAPRYIFACTLKCTHGYRFATKS